MVPAFGFPRCVYNDNGTHLTGFEITTYFSSHGTTQITASIMHPSSVGLIEQNVQLVTSQIWKWVLDRGPSANEYWRCRLQETLPAINGRLISLHGFIPGEILLGYTPEWKINLDPNSINARELHTTPDALGVNEWVDRRDERREQAIQTMAANQTKMERK